MKKHRALRRFFLALALCAAPYVILPPLCDYCPDGVIWVVSFVLCYLLVPVSAAAAPYWMARGGVSAIAAWPWPALCVLILPLWGMQPGWGMLAAGMLVGMISAVAGEERTKRLEMPPKGRRKKR